jgi:hypothetical protein
VIRNGLEPWNKPSIGQAKAREENDLIFIPPGGQRKYDLEIEVLNTKEKIDIFLNSARKEN